MLWHNLISALEKSYEETRKNEIVSNIIVAVYDKLIVDIILNSRNTQSTCNSGMRQECTLSLI